MTRRVEYHGDDDTQGDGKSCGGEDRDDGPYENEKKTVL